MIQKIKQCFAGFVSWFKSWFVLDMTELSLVEEKSEVSSQGVKVPYLINDPTTPDLVKEVDLPAHPAKLDFWVKGYNRGSVKPGTSQHQAANCYVTVANCIHYMQDMVSRSRPRIHRWAATNKLAVIPNAGRMLNAYYDRRGLHFFWEVSPKTKKRIYTADSADIVAHELGHALLDAMRPDFWSVQALEIWSFHESFADITAILSLMQYDEILDRALHETKGDLSRPNVISRLAEEMGNIIFEITKGRGGLKPGALRNATNDFRYIDPSRLPKNAPDNKLAAECHSFGRIFLGAWYDVMVGIYNEEKKDSTPIKALQHARDVSAEYLLKSIPVTPRVVNYSNAAAKSFLAMDRSKGSPYQKIIKKVFAQRRLIDPSIKMLSNTTWDDVREMLKKTDEVVKNPHGMVVKLSRDDTLQLNRSGKGEISAMSVGGFDLTKLDLEVATDFYYEFDADGTLIEEVRPRLVDVRQAAYACAMSIMQDGAVGKGSDTMWEVQDNKLVRTYIQ